MVSVTPSLINRASSRCSGAVNPMLSIGCSALDLRQVPETPRLALSPPVPRHAWEMSARIELLQNRRLRARSPRQRSSYQARIARYEQHIRVQARISPAPTPSGLGRCCDRRGPAEATKDRPFESAGITLPPAIVPTGFRRDCVTSANALSKLRLREFKLRLLPAKGVQAKVKKRLKYDQAGGVIPTWLSMRLGRLFSMWLNTN